MVWRTFCIVLIRVIVILFYPKSWNIIGVLSLFSEKSCKLAKQDITWRIDVMKIEDQWFLEGILRHYKMIIIHFKFQSIARRKNARKWDENCKICTWGAAKSTFAHEAAFSTTSGAPVHAPYAWYTSSEFLLRIFQADLVEKPYFIS